jgi:hypothetical protein
MRYGREKAFELTLVNAERTVLSDANSQELP